MADSKITALTSIGTSTDPVLDQMVIVDVSDGSMAATGTTKKVSLNQLLSSNPSATGGLTLSGALAAGSATITGDLTVDTSTLKVDSANNRVGIGIATPNRNAVVYAAASPVLQICDSTTGTTANDGLLITQAGVDAYIENAEIGAMNFRTSAVTRYQIDSTGISTWSVGGSTAMTLNSTGLGVGTSPSSILHLQKSQDAETTLIVNNTNTGTSAGVRLDLQSNAANYLTLESYGQNASGSILGVNKAKLNAIFENALTANSSGLAIGTLSANALYFGTNNTLRATIDSSGNVGVGVTPSATDSTYFQALEIARVGQGLTAAKNALTGSPSSWLSNNSYATYSSGVVWNYAISQPAAQYRLFEGQHQWFNAAAGAANAAITDFATAKMTLDASGNLLIKKTSASGSTLGVELLATGQINGATANQDNLNIYNTTAAAYRFYVSSAGTIFATNTTISAISDARFKENVEDIDVGLGAILALKPRKFDWKDGKGKNIKGDRGFIAQEFETVFPNLIDEWKDNAPEGEAPYKSVRQDLIPVLVKAIQELTARVQTLEAK